MVAVDELDDTFDATEGARERDEMGGSRKVCFAASAEDGCDLIGARRAASASDGGRGGRSWSRERIGWSAGNEFRPRSGGRDDRGGLTRVLYMASIASSSTSGGDPLLARSDSRYDDTGMGAGEIWCAEPGAEMRRREKSDVSNLARVVEDEEGDEREEREGGWAVRSEANDLVLVRGGGWKLKI